MSRSAHNRGFTLVETIVYLFILALISVVIVTLLVNLVQAFYRFRAMERVAHSADLALERFSREVRRAISVNSFNGNLLVLNTTDTAGDPTTITFATSTTVMTVQEGSALAATTTDAGVTVSNLVFRNVSAALPPAVRLELTLTDPIVLPGRQFKFYDTVILRGSY